MAKNKVSEWSSTPANNTDISGIDIAEGCAPSGINNAIREMMAQVKDFSTGADGDNFTVGGNLSVTGTSTLTGAVTATAGVTGNVTGNVSGTAANVTGTVAVANGGTGLTTLIANNVMLGNGTSTPSFVAPSTSGNVLTSNGTTWQSVAPTSSSISVYRSRYIIDGTTYTPASDVAAFWVFVYGSLGGISAASRGSIGGRGYSEKYYSTPSGSYTYSIGAAGANTGTAGGTTTFDVISVTGSGGVTTTTGSAGGVGSGGDFNATGGTGGNFSTNYGGGGGCASRAGNGGNGGNGGATAKGGGGGTGGNAGGTNNGVDGTGATTPSISALVLPFGQTKEIFSNGANSYGATAISVFDGVSTSAYYPLNLIAAAYGNYLPLSNYPYNTWWTAPFFATGANAGSQGFIWITEKLK